MARIKYTKDTDPTGDINIYDLRDKYQKLGYHLSIDTCPVFITFELNACEDCGFEGEERNRNLFVNTSEQTVAQAIAELDHKLGIENPNYKPPRDDHFIEIKPAPSTAVKEG